jgi:hypothetical protein
VRRCLLWTVAFVVAGCASSHGQAQTGQPRSHGPLTDEQYHYALVVAQREAHRTARTITSATVTLGHGRVTDPNRGHKCLSGTELHVKLIGTFNIGVGGPPVSTTSPSADYAVHGVLITVDAATGEECLLSVQTGRVTPDRGATVLFTH